MTQRMKILYGCSAAEFEAHCEIALREGWSIHMPSFTVHIDENIDEYFYVLATKHENEDVRRPSEPDPAVK